MYLRNYLIALTSLGLSVFIAPIMQVLPAIAQPSQINSPANSDTATEKIKADQLVAEGEALLKTSDDFFYVLSKYVDALIIYRKIDDQTAAEITRQRFEQILADNQTLLNRKRDSIRQAKAEFVKQFPIVPAHNQTATDLEKIAGELGILLHSSTEESVNQSKKSELEKIEMSMSQFLDQQITDPTNQLDKLPNNLQTYLTNNQAALNRIRNLIVNGEPLQWKFQPTWQIDDPLPSFLGLVRLQKILLLDAIAQKAAGNSQLMQENLETAWQINQSIKNDPYLMSQLVGLIALKQQVGLMRKLGDLPAIWQERLLSHDYRSSMLKSLNTEAYTIFDLLDEIDPAELQELMGEGEIRFLVNAGWEKWSPTSQKNFLAWLGIALHEYSLKTYNNLSNQNVCQFKMDEFLQGQGIRQRELVFLQGFTRQWYRAGQAMVNLELTQKVLELLAMQVNSQDLPNTVVASNICPGTNWVYQLKPSEMMIEINPQPSEWPGQHTLPLKFIGKFPPK
jgi:hypothetical protein